MIHNINYLSMTKAKQRILKQACMLNNKTEASAILAITTYTVFSKCNTDCERQIETHQGV